MHPQNYFPFPDLLPFAIVIGSVLIAGILLIRRRSAGSQCQCLVSERIPQGVISDDMLQDVCYGIEMLGFGKDRPGTYKHHILKDGVKRQTDISARVVPESDFNLEQCAQRDRLIANGEIDGNKPMVMIVSIWRGQRRSF